MEPMEPIGLELWSFQEHSPMEPSCQPSAANAYPASDKGNAKAVHVIYPVVFATYNMHE